MDMDEPEVEQSAEAVDRFLQVAKDLANTTDLHDEHVLSCLIIAVAVCAKVILACAVDPISEEEAMDEMIRQLRSAFAGIDAKPMEIH